MSESGDRARRPGGKPEGNRSDSGRPARGAPTGHRGPRRDDTKPPRSGAGEKRLWTREGAPARGDRTARERELPEDRDPYGTQSVRSRHDDPLIPEDVKPGELDRVARAQLKTLSKENADGVANHLVMVARLIDSDPQLAHQHAVSAARRAGRIAVVRETLAITAYSIGDFALALRELRTYRRISGKNDQLPMMVDSERGLGRPDKALELGRSVERATLATEVQVELAIAMSGARLDLGDPETALLELEIPQLDPETAYSYSPDLFDAYATVLEDLGRTADAELWWKRSDRASAALSAAAGEEDDEVVEVEEEELDDGGEVDQVSGGKGEQGTESERSE
ncbi:MAG: hypothetical protein ABI053_06295 [Lacisediminihabitans sp.]